MYNMQPGRLDPVYSHRTETNAQSCYLRPWSLADSEEKRNRTLQNHKLSMLIWKSPLRIPGGRTKTMSWWLDLCSCFVLKGQQDTRFSPGYFVCPIRSVENRWPESLAESSTWRVSRREWICIYAIYVFIYVICNICCIWIKMWYMQTTYLLCIHKAMNRSARWTSRNIR